MVRGNRVLWMVMLAFVAGSLGGCKALKKRSRQKEALAFNNKLADYNKRISGDAKALGELVGKRLSGGKVTNQQLDAGLAKLKATVADVRKKSQALKVPDDSLARELMQAYQKFLDGQDRLVKKVEELVALVKAPVGANSAKARMELIGKVRPILKSVQEEEQKSLKALQAVQRRYASKHNITLM